jgi:hypothetical protein
MVTTEPDLSVSPSNLRTVPPITDKSITIAWDPISFAARRGLTVSIRIRILELPAEVVVADVLVPDSGEYTIEGLKPATTYTFTLFVEFESLVGENGTSISVSTTAGN